MLKLDVCFKYLSDAKIKILFFMCLVYVLSNNNTVKPFFLLLSFIFQQLKIHVRVEYIHRPKT